MEGLLSTEPIQSFFFYMLLFTKVIIYQTSLMLLLLCGQKLEFENFAEENVENLDDNFENETFSYLNINFHTFELEG